MNVDETKKACRVKVNRGPKSLHTPAVHRYEYIIYNMNDYYLLYVHVY